MRLPRARMWIVAAAGLMALGALLVTGAVSAVEALRLAIFGGVVAALVGVVRALRRLTREVERTRQSVAANTRGIAEAVGEDRVESLHRADEISRMLRGLREEDVPRLAREAAEARDTSADRLTELTHHVTQRGHRDYAQYVAWQELRDHLRPPPFMPPLRGWAASPDVVRLLVRVVHEHQPKLVVECGSGASSVWLGYALRRRGEGRLVALEHDERYAELSRELVAEHGLEDLVEIRYAPLRSWRPDPVGAAGESSAASPEPPWYDPEAVSDLVDIDLIFVDGPPGATAAEARYPAGPMLFSRCSAGATVVMDDANRDDERRIAERWLAENPDLDRVDADTEKGAYVLTWQRR